MKYAVYLPTFTPYGSARIIAGLAADAEQAGWDGLFVWDDVAGSEEDLVDPWIALAAAAVATRRVRLGVMVTPLARRRPWKYARETVTLDHLCGGRLTVGVGAGGGQEQFGDLGDEPDQRTRGAMLDEALAVVSGLWSGEPFALEGRYYHLQPTTFRPRPLQQPRIPIWVAGTYPHRRPLERMARWDGMFPLFWGISDPQEQRARLDVTVQQVMALRRRLYPGAQPSFDVVMSGETPPDRPAQTQALTAGFGEVGATWWFESLAPAWGGGGRDWTFEQLRARVLAGPLGAG